MENVSGHRPDDLEFLDANGIDRDEVSAALSRIFNEVCTHCIPHLRHLPAYQDIVEDASGFWVPVANALQLDDLWQQCSFTLRSPRR